MKINKEKCIGCQQCYFYCPVEAIYENGDIYQVDYDLCVECNICYNSNTCPTDALEKDSLENEMRLIRCEFSDPLSSHGSTSVLGRGTEEMKTNDVTHRFTEDKIGVAIEMGRPGTGTSFKDVEKMAMVCAKYDISFEKENPVTTLMVDTDSGKLRDDVLNERALSAIVEFVISIDDLNDVLEDIIKASDEIETLFSLDVAAKVSDDQSIATTKVMDKVGIKYAPNGKLNIGLGKL